MGEARAQKKAVETNTPPPSGSGSRIRGLSPGTIWPLITGLAVGFVVARELPRGGSSGPAAERQEAAPVAAAPSAPTPAAAPRPAAAGPKLQVSAASPRKGAKAPKVLIAEVSDFQCPFCSRAVPVMKEIHEKYPKDVAVAFVNQPLSFHNMAKGAAIAGLAAHRQGKFWEMHDKMFANQQTLNPPDLERYAGEIGLNMAKFKKDFADPAVKSQVEADQANASAAGANGTPTFFINGRKMVGAKPFAEFKTVIDEEIKKADDLIKAGTPVAQVTQKLIDQAPSEAPPPAAPAAPSGPEPPEFVKNVVIGNAPAKGPSAAKIQLVIFSDFQCPFCDKVRPTIKQIEDEYKGKVRIAFKQLPIKFHNNAQIAAEASLAANEQGKFWEFHDKMYDNQSNLDRLSLEKYAQELKLDLKKFRAALDSGKYKQQITNDLAEAGASSTTSTPTFFINGHRLIGTQPYGAFKRIIDDELKKSS